ncbi:MAG: SUF system Fe-S cluster assembly regulator [Gammaproteobacteria bacterium]|nr:SUF system Fe-S cluster assembly regulator [Gammaproteobacteria bacterium]
MLRVSKLTDYAMVIMSYLALMPEQAVSAANIAKEVHLAFPTVSKILKILLEANLLVSFRGTGGGYQLARSADEITLTHIVRALEGNLAMTECCSTKKSCVIESICTLKDNWQMINNIILTTLSSVTLKNMMQPLAQNNLMLKGIPIVKGF